MGKERIHTKRKKQSNLKSSTHLDESITKGRIMERNIDEELKRFNNELFQLSKKFQELHDLTLIRKRRIYSVFQEAKKSLIQLKQQHLSTEIKNNGGKEHI